MNFVKPILLAFAMSSPLIVPAMAESEKMMMKEQTITMVSPAGQVSTVPVADTVLVDSLIKNGRVLSAGHLLLMSGGKIYVIDDVKQANGKMLSETLGG